MRNICDVVDEMIKLILRDESGLLVLLDEIEADRPFSKIYTGEEAGIIAPIVGCDKWILPRSVFYGCVGRSIECTPGWVLCMLDFQFTLHGLPLESLHNEIEHEFDIKEINGSKDNGVDYIRDT
jgi:hypothetical protein